MIRPQYIFDFADELLVDNFAGGGGASTGIERALGRHVDIAINHDPEAVAMHSANHPQTRHFCESVWDVDPREATGGRPVGLAWFSPDCTFHSKARGGKPHRDRNRARRRRGLAWVVVRWAEAVRPRVICLENVEEFADWGPLADDGRPCPLRRGTTFRRWMARLQNLGYEVDCREMRACDYGAPTSRKRLFIVARCDGQPIVWPTPTYGKGRRPYRTAAECIDWTLPTPSIFERERPLAENTLRRIAAGIKRYVLDAAEPYIVQTPAGKVSPTLVQTGYGEREGQAPRVPGLDKPLGTVVAGGQKHALVAAFLARHFTGVVGADLWQPLHTITATDHHSLVTAALEPGRDHRDPVRAFLVAYFGNERDGQAVTEPMRTITTKERFGLVTVAGHEYVIADIGMRMLAPRELYTAQGFPPDYIIGDRPEQGLSLPKVAQVRMCGNSVSPVIAEALVRANVGEIAIRRAA